MAATKCWLRRRSWADGDDPLAELVRTCREVGVKVATRRRSGSGQARVAPWPPRRPVAATGNVGPTLTERSIGPRAEAIGVRQVRRAVRPRCSKVSWETTRRQCRASTVHRLPVLGALTRPGVSDYPRSSRRGHHTPARLHRRRCPEHVARLEIHARQRTRPDGGSLEPEVTASSAVALSNSRWPDEDEEIGDAAPSSGSRRGRWLALAVSKKPL